MSGPTDAGETTWLAPGGLLPAAVHVPLSMAPWLAYVLRRHTSDRLNGGLSLTSDQRTLVMNLERAATVFLAHSVATSGSESSDSGTTSAVIGGTQRRLPDMVEVGVCEAAGLLGVSTGYVRRLARVGKLEARKSGAREWLISLTAIDERRSA